MRLNCFTIKSKYTLQPKDALGEEKDAGERGTLTSGSFCLLLADYEARRILRMPVHQQC